MARVLTSGTVDAQHSAPVRRGGRKRERHVLPRVPLASTGQQPAVFTMTLQRRRGSLGTGWKGQTAHRGHAERRPSHPGLRRAVPAVTEPHRSLRPGTKPSRAFPAALRPC